MRAGWHRGGSVGRVRITKEAEDGERWEAVGEVYIGAGATGGVFWG